MALDTNTNKRLATSSQTPPTGDGAIVLDAVLQRIHNMASVSSIPFLSLEPLREDLTARAEMGLKKYGTKLRVNNGRRAIVDFYQEMQDALMYAMQARLEGDKETGQYFELLASVTARVAVELNKRG
jgi:hypothetical protein